MGVIFFLVTGRTPMDSERELKCLAAVWALRGILTPEGFKDFKLNDGLVCWDKEELEELVDYLKAKETPATVQLLSANSRSTPIYRSWSHRIRGGISSSVRRIYEFPS